MEEGPAPGGWPSWHEELLNSLDSIVWEMEPASWRYTFVSERALPLLGYPTRLWTDDQNFWWSVVHPEDRDWAYELSKGEASAGRGFRIECRYVAADGRTLWMANIASHVSGPSGPRLRGIMVDISSRVAAQAELKRLSEELAGVNAELMEYAKAVSHDLRSPLRAIHNYASFLEEDLGASLDSLHAGYLLNLRKATVEADSLVEGLLRISRVSSHRMDWRDVDMRVFLERVIEGMELPQGASVRLQPDDWPLIESEPALLRQIFQNLISNAVKFNRSESRLVELSWAASADGASISFSVADNGIGISPEDSGRIFGMFQRLNPKESFEGVGIGLSIVKRAVKRLSGSISVACSSLGGSIFSVTLPRRS